MTLLSWQIALDINKTRRSPLCCFQNKHHVFFFLMSRSCLAFSLMISRKQWECDKGGDPKIKEIKRRKEKYMPAGTSSSLYPHEWSPKGLPMHLTSACLHSEKDRLIACIASCTLAVLLLKVQWFLSCHNSQRTSITRDLIPFLNFGWARENGLHHLKRVPSLLPVTYVSLVNIFWIL